jgi:peptide chain release factor 2
VQKEDIEKRIQEIDALMTEGDFWANKAKAQGMIRERQELQAKLEGASLFDKGSAILSILSGAGGDDAEDFTRMLLEMYLKYFAKRGWGFVLSDFLFWVE